MRILVVGAGAVGGYFGGRLAQAGRDITFLVRPGRAAELRANGLRILSPHGDLTLEPKTIAAEQISDPYDVILLSVKSYALDAAMGDFAAAAGPATMILPVLNGMRHMDLLAARFGKAAVLGGVCLVATEIDPDGRIKQIADFQKLIYGEPDGTNTERLRQLDGCLRGAGFDTEVSNRILNDMWQKWVQLATLGSVTCLLRGSVGQIVSIPGGADVALEALRECSAIAAAGGYQQSDAFLTAQKAALTAPGSALTSSMYRDLIKGAPVEADTILGDLLRHGREHGLSSPILQAAFVNLSVYQRARSAAAK